MLKIDGAKVRQLREEKGLTQLYLATAVGVTTDTISRWEHKKYPAVKKENALKLAEALEVPVEAILDAAPGADGCDEAPIQAPPVEHPSEGSPATPPPPLSPPPAAPSTPPLLLAPPAPKRPSPLAWWAGGIVLAIAVVTAWILLGPTEERVTVRRIVPDHTAPGQSFPVMIRIENEEGRPASVIVREQVPARCQVVRGKGDKSAPSVKNDELQWLVRVKEPVTTLSYQLRPGKEIGTGAALDLTGEVTQRVLGSTVQNIEGGTRVNVTEFHWADQNQDGRIDDGEMLSVYDEFGDVAGLDLGLIEDIWFGGGYTWDPGKKQFALAQ